MEILSLMAKEHKGVAPELSLRQRSRSGNNAVGKHKREAEEQQKQRNNECREAAERSRGSIEETKEEKEKRKKNKLRRDKHT